MLDKKINTIERVNEEHFDKLFHHEKTMESQSSDINEIKDTINLSVK